MMAKKRKPERRPKGGWCVVWRSGGREHFRWQRTLPVNLKEHAADQQQAIVKMGYHAFVVDYHQSMAIGLPETYEPVQGKRQ